MKMKTLGTIVFTCGLAATVKAQSVINNGGFSGNGLDHWTVVAIEGYTNAPYALGTGGFQFPGKAFGSAFDAQVGDPAQLDLEQTVLLSAGIQYDFSADVAAYYPAYNIDGGTITLSIGGNEVTSISFGTNTGGTLYGTLNGSYIPNQSGGELLILNFSRGEMAGPSTPWDYIGNLSLVPVPEPSAAVLAGLGTSALLLLRRRAT